MGKNDRYDGIEVAGTGMYPVVRALSASALCRVLLEKHGLDDVKTDRFYPLKNYLALLADIGERMPVTLKKIGSFITAEAKFPPGIDSFEAILGSTDVAYRMNHRGCEGKDDIGHYACTLLEKGKYLMKVDVPYPCPFDEGIFLGMAEHFQKKITIRHQGVHCRLKGAPRCLYEIEEEKGSS